jgi:hypothetical protein
VRADGLQKEFQAASAQLVKLTASWEAEATRLQELEAR